MDKLTLQRIKSAHPSIREELRELYLYANNKLLGKGVRLRFSHVLRTDKEQNDLYAIGRTKPGKKVTNAKGGQSYHNYGFAFDIVLLYDKDGNGTFEAASWDRVFDGDGDGVADWKEITDFFESKGYQNGFRKNGKKWDFPHFQKVPNGFKWKQLQCLRKDREGYVVLPENC